MRSGCRSKHFSICGGNDTADNVFGADIFVTVAARDHFASILEFLQVTQKHILVGHFATSCRTSVGQFDEIHAGIFIAKAAADTAAARLE